MTNTILLAEQDVRHIPEGKIEIQIVNGLMRIFLIPLDTTKPALFTPAR